MTTIKFRWPVTQNTIITQAAADAQVGRKVYVGGPAPARRGVITAATVVGDGEAVEVTVELLDAIS
ncbi:hypothetical protein [Streptomyces sp. NPDC088752]|uniref:hypothetical protein n=1 Tax=Streptomyces sp. NPDC088752 TaxID=3154963 RepID=UPI00343288AD